jgi:hypothetical protein
MKTLIIGEIINNNLSSGTLEILGKAKSMDLEPQVITVVTPNGYYLWF